MDQLEELKVPKHSPDFLIMMLKYVMVNFGLIYYLIIFWHTIYGHGGHFGQVT